MKGDLINCVFQCDPEYLQNGDVQLSPRVMWIFKMEDVSSNNYIQICEQGVLGTGTALILCIFCLSVCTWQVMQL